MYKKMSSNNDKLRSKVKEQLKKGLRVIKDAVSLPFNKTVPIKPGTGKKLQKAEQNMEIAASLIKTSKEEPAVNEQKMSLAEAGYLRPKLTPKIKKLLEKTARSDTRKQASLIRDNNIKQKMPSTDADNWKSEIKTLLEKTALSDTREHAHDNNIEREMPSTDADNWKSKNDKPSIFEYFDQIPSHNHALDGLHEENLEIAKKLIIQQGEGVLGKTSDIAKAAEIDMKVAEAMIIQQGEGVLGKTSDMNKLYPEYMQPVQALTANFDHLAETTRIDMENAGRSLRMTFDKNLPIDPGLSEAIMINAAKRHMRDAGRRLSMELNETVPIDPGTRGLTWRDILFNPRAALQRALSIRQRNAKLRKAYNKYKIKRKTGKGDA
ncbi:hypothetical protein OAR19_00380 [bacterium]|nr:hypothetical protein [bacterium]